MAVGASKPTAVADADGFFFVKSKMLGAIMAVGASNPTAVADANGFFSVKSKMLVYGQPIYAKYEEWLGKKWPESTFFHHVYKLQLPFSKSFRFTLCRIVLRTAFVVLTILVGMLLPFFNAIVGLLGSIAFWPITVYYPVTVYMAQAKIKRGQQKWVVLQGLSMIALLVSFAAAIGSVADIAQRLKHVTIFKTKM